MSPSPYSLATSTWVAHAVTFFFLGLAFCIAAHRRSGKFLQWPVGLRWLFATFFMTWSVLAIDVFLVRWNRGQGFWGDPNKPDSAFLRYAPVPIGIWIFYRLMTKGLGLDEQERQHGQH